MNKVVQWYQNNRNEITWFVIGTCTITGLTALAHKDYSGAMLNLGIAYLNYMMNKQ